MPLALLRLRNLACANVVGLLWASAMFAWFFLSALYLQLVLHFSPLEVGLSFLPANLIMGAFSLGLSAKLVLRFGTRTPIVVGLSLAGAGLLLFLRLPVAGSFAADVLPSMVLLGLGAGMALNPVLLVAMGDVAAGGLRSGQRHRQHLVHDGRGARARGAGHDRRVADLGPAPQRHSVAASLVGGYRLAFAVGAGCALLGAALAAAVLRPAAIGESALEPGAVPARVPDAG